MVKYLVVYKMWFKSGEATDGRVQVICARELEDIEDVIQIEEDLKQGSEWEKDITTLLITNIQRFPI